MNTPLPPHFLRLTSQNGIHADCAIVALAHCFGITYEEILALAAQISPEVLYSGLTWSEMRRVADMMGRRVKLLRRGYYDLDEATGVLNVRSRTIDHAVYLWAGRIVEGAGELWLDPEDYCAHRGVKPYSLLVRVE